MVLNNIFEKMYGFKKHQKLGATLNLNHNRGFFFRGYHNML